MASWLFRLFAILALLPIASSAAASDPAMQLDARVGLNAFTSLVEQEFADAKGTLRVLAATEDARSGNWNRIRGPLTILAKNSPNSAAVWFARPDGSYFTVQEGQTNQTLKSRDYFPGLMAGKEVAGALVVSKSTGKRSAIFAVPVISDGRVVGAIGTSIALEKVGAQIEKEIRLPDNMVFYALDGRGEIALHRQSALLFEFATEQGSPTLTKAVPEMLTKAEGVASYEFEGSQRTAIYKKSDATGWVFALRW